jgi:hypothetical protein
MLLSTLLLLPKNLASVTDATYCTDRRNIRLIEGNAKCRHLKDWPVKGLCGRCLSVWGPFPPRFSFGVVKQFYYIGSESGQKQSVKLLQNMVSNTPPPPLSHTLTVYSVLWLWEGGEGWGRWTREKVRGAIAHNVGPKIPTWLTAYPVYKLY